MAQRTSRHDRGAEKSFDGLYDRVKHLPQNIQEAMMAAAVNAPPAEPTKEEILEYAHSINGVASLLWLLVVPQQDAMELRSLITDDNRLDVLKQLEAANVKMTAEASAAYLKQIQEQSCPLP